MAATSSAGAQGTEGATDIAGATGAVADPEVKAHRATLIMGRVKLAEAPLVALPAEVALAAKEAIEDRAAAEDTIGFSHLEIELDCGECSIPSLDLPTRG